MKVAVVGSRSIFATDIGAYISDGDEIVSGGALGIDSCAAEYAKKNGLKLTVFLPQYERYGRVAQESTPTAPPETISSPSDIYILISVAKMLLEPTTATFIKISNRILCILKLSILTTLYHKIILKYTYIKIFLEIL